MQMVWWMHMLVPEASAGYEGGRSDLLLRGNSGSIEAGTAPVVE